MADVINLRQARKARARVKAQDDAAQNRARFGRTKGEKLRDDAESAQVVRLLDGTKREKEQE